MTTKVGQLKPFMIEEKKEGPTRSVTETTANKWQGCILANIKKEEKWLKFLPPKTWKAKKTVNRGFTGAEAAADTTQVDMLLEYISQYAPNALYRDITIRATSLDAVWTLVRNWAGLKTSGCKQQSYFTVKHSYDSNGDLSPTDFYFSLRNAKEDCLLLSAEHGGKITFHGSIPAEDEDLSPTLESDVVLDWLYAMGGTKLVEHTLRVFSKELETESLADLRQRISDNLSSLSPEAEQADLNRTFVPKSSPRFNQPNRNFPPRQGKPFHSQFQPTNLQTARPTYQQRPTGPSAQTTSPGLVPPCKLCLLNKPAVAHTHGIATCSQLNGTEQKHFTRAVITDDQEVTNSPGYPTYDYTLDTESDQNDDNYETEYDETTDVVPVIAPANACLTQISRDTVMKINRVNIHESPILACCANSRTIYVLLDTGATASIITQKMADILNLKVHKTGHRAVQVDGESQLPVLGEVHTTFTRGTTTLHFSGLVVSRLGVDLLGGTNFHVENDVYSRMAKGTIHIGDSCTIQSSPPSLLTLDSMATSSSQRLIKIPTNTILLPGDDFTISAPPDFPPNSFVMIEPNLRQTKPFFTPIISQLDGSCITIQNQSHSPIHLKKNCQAFSVSILPHPPPPSQ